jgi:hypothetical protein
LEEGRPAQTGNNKKGGRGGRFLDFLMPRSLFNQSHTSQEDERALGESMFRSSPMSLIQLYIPMEAAQVVTMRAGDLGLIQFRDVHKAMRALSY